jgi:hypothetical protein
MAATWRANTFLLVSFPVGIATFSFLVTAIALGVSLAIAWVGVDTCHSARTSSSSYVITSGS